MKSHKLARFVIPIPPPKPVCAACKAWSPEVTMPVGDGAVDLCWLCAHHHVDHGATLREAPTAQCECTAAEIYPADYRQCGFVRFRAPTKPIPVFKDRGEVIAHLVAGGMSRQEAKAQTFGLDAPAWRARNGRSAGTSGAGYAKPRKSR